MSITVSLLQLLPRFRRARAAFDGLAERETWTRRQITEFQLKRINGIWQHARRWVPYYRALAEQLDLPTDFSSLEEYRKRVPLLPKDEVRNNPLSFLSERRERGRWRCTSGSTGSPMRIYRASSSHQEMLQSKYRLYHTWGVNPLDRMAVLWGTAQRTHGSFSKVRRRCQQAMVDALRGRLRLSAYYSDRDTLRRQLQQIAAFRPASIYGFSQAVWLLAQQARQDDFHCDSLKAIFLTSEPAFKRVRSDVAEAFQVPVAIEYGATECEAIAGQHLDGTLRVREDVAMLETNARPDGRGDIILTVLLNPSFPLLRYEIGDVSEDLLQMTNQGFAILPDVGGRTDDLLTTQKRRHVHPSLVDACFEEQFAHLPIRRYRLHQACDGAVHALLEVEAEALPATAIRDIQSQLQSIVEGYHVRVDVVRHIQVPETGKLRTVTSDMPSPTARASSIVSASTDVEGEA